MLDLESNRRRRATLVRRQPLGQPSPFGGLDPHHRRDGNCRVTSGLLAAPQRARDSGLLLLPARAPQVATNVAREITRNPRHGVPAGAKEASKSACHASRVSAVTRCILGIDNDLPLDLGTRCQNAAVACIVPSAGCDNQAGSAFGTTTSTKYTGTRLSQPLRLELPALRLASQRQAACALHLYTHRSLTEDNIAVDREEILVGGCLVHADPGLGADVAQVRHAVASTLTVRRQRAPHAGCGSRWPAGHPLNIAARRDPDRDIGRRSGRERWWWWDARRVVGPAPHASVPDTTRWWHGHPTASPARSPEVGPGAVGSTAIQYAWLALPVPLQTSTEGATWHTHRGGV